MAAREQSDSGGLVDSRFIAWIEAERGSKGRYLDFVPAGPPGG
jgi:hypothetical protein